MAKKTKARGELPPRGEPTGGFKAYPDCTSSMSIMCLRPDCIRCSAFMASGSRRVTEEALTLAYFYKEICKQFHATRPLPPRIMGIINFFDPNMNAHASEWNWTKINSDVERCAKKFWRYE